MKRTLPALLGLSVAFTSAAPTSQGQPTAPTALWRVEGEGRGVPAVDEQTAYFLGKRHDVIAIGRDTGKVRWRARTGEPGESTVGDAVTVTSGVVVVGDYNLMAFNADDGGLRWRFLPDDGYAAGVFLGGAADGIVFTGSPAGRVYALDAASGALRWSSAISDRRETTVYEPIVSGQQLFAGYTHFRIPETGGVVALDRATGRVRWKSDFPETSNVMSQTNWAGGLVLEEGLVIASAGDGNIYALDRDTGERKWTIPKVSGEIKSIVRPSDVDHRVLALARRVLVAGSLTGYVIAYDTATQKERWRHAGGVDGSTSFIFANDANTVYVPYVSGMLVALDIETGQEKWRMGDYQIGFMWPPLVVGDAIYIGATRTGFHAFPTR
jgi:outer membrane protein assembly factor BamB